MRTALIVFLMISIPAYIIMKVLNNGGTPLQLLSIIYIILLAAGLGLFTWWIRRRNSR